MLNIFKKSEITLDCERRNFFSESVRTQHEEHPPCTLLYAFNLPPPPSFLRTYFMDGPQRRIKGDVQITTEINFTKIKTCEILSLFLKAKQPVLSFILMFNFCLTSFIVFVNYFIVLNSLMHV